ncbi:hypothetical protein A4A49_15105 [Nicotiana attenuata]|uniref:F-box domain-containing protein n=1 Tax=Nicotiana attenuata TaxID=49451 RepID=A0A1J6IC36_NICAT|nr:hypothetical protein A4A49_15105 [Nicotiana attenuata]
MLMGHFLNKKKEESFFNNLTDELLIEILSRLPTSKTIRCKLVCKRWFSLISSDYFVTHHLKDDKTLLPFTFVLNAKDNYRYVLKFLSGNGLSDRVDLGFLYTGRPLGYRISLKESYGDLILCSGKPSSGIDFFICNIFTKQWIVLPPAPLETSHFKENEGVGFLIEPNYFEYLVLRFIPLGDFKFNIQMFSSEQGKWNKLVVTSPRNLNILTRKTRIVACGRMLYTFTYKRSDVVDCVLAFDPFTNDPARFLCVIDFPPEAREIPCLTGKLGVCQGHLRFAQLILQPSGYPCISIWELEDDYRMGNWTLLHKRISTHEALRVPILKRDTKNSVSVLAFHPYNKDLICFLVGKDCVVVYNIRTGEVESSTRPSLFKHKEWPRSLAADVGSRLLPITQNWWPTPVRQTL